MLGIMATRTSIVWTVILFAAQVVVIGELIATRVSPLARQFTGWSVYAAVITLIAIPFLLIASPFFWRSHRRLAISSLCVAVGAIGILSFHAW
jgi:sorbitol-specific phosphotransferase system component IIBC